ncbi:MAG: hypothetical protein WED05_08605 [Candidatus Atabeyarchaeum deiterrae]
MISSAAHLDVLAESDLSLEKPIASKLFIKENYSILLLGEPEGYLVRLGKLPKNVSRQ